MPRLEIQGIVSASNTQPLVEVRQLDDNDKELVKFQLPVMEAREVAQTINEAATNAVYEAALISWAVETGNLDMGINLIDIIRKFRADHWGLPDKPEDWRKKDD